MPTMNPRITITVSEELMQRIDEYRFTNRMRNQTQAIVSLINIGFEALSEGKVQPKFSEEEVHIIELYNNTEPTHQSVIMKMMQDNQVQKIELRA